MSRIFAALVFCVVLLAVATQALGQGVVQSPEPNASGILFEYKFKEKELLRYNLELTFDVVMQADIPEASAIPPMYGRMTGIVSQQTKRILENGDAEIVAAIESMKIDMMGQSTDLPADKMPPFTYVMSKLGMIKSIDVQNLKSLFNEIPFGDLANFSQHTFFPAKPVKIGETWRQDIPSPFPGAGTFHAEMKLLRLDAEIGKERAAVIQQNSTGEMDIAQAMAALQKSNGEVSGKADIATNFLMYFSPDQGRLIKAEGNGTMQMNMSFKGQNGGPNQMKMNVQMKCNLNLLPERAK
ncbi:MAG: hypothetical protein K6T99_04765 [Armatimonadetes bacterium]|nr:hypothetical protein [Armatimonadota bacterium]